MRSPPVELSVEEVAAAVERGWGLGATSVEYVPEGGGSHHWKAVGGDGRSHFVTVDDLDHKPWMGDGGRAATMETLRRAMGTAVALHDRAGLDFVVAPVAGRDGELVRRLDDRFTVSLFPFLVGRSHPFGPYGDPALREAAVEMLVALHGATEAVREQVPPHAPTFGGRGDLEAVLGEPDRGWASGPFDDAARQLIAPRVRELATLVARFDRLVAACQLPGQELVVTHGEPHPANLMSVGAGCVLLDWDTVGLAPPERDLSLVLGEAAEDLARYEDATRRQVDDRLLLLYRARWYLDDVASAVRLFRNRHRDDRDTRGWLAALPGRLAELPLWLERVGGGTGSR